MLLHFSIALILSSEIIPVNGKIFRVACRRDATFKLVGRDKRLDVVIAASAKSKSLALCAKLCLDTPSCKSLNYNRNSKVCQALSESRTTAGALKLISQTDWKHYEPLQKQEHLAPVCRRHLQLYPCQDLEKCEDDCTSSTGYKCVSLANIALQKPTIDAPNYPGRASSRAVDGNTATNWLSSSCTHTICCAVMPWWRVDFGKTAVIYAVKITNRSDCCGDRLSNFNVRIGESSTGRGEGNEACVSNVGVGQGATQSFICNPRSYGRYLYVQSNLNKDLTICELQAFGEII